MINEMESSESQKRDTLDNVQHLSKSGDVTSRPSYKTTTGIGAVMVLASILLTLLNFPFAFDVTALAWGSIIIALGQYFQHRENVMAYEVRKGYLQLEHETALRNYKLLLTQKVLSLLPSSDITFENIESLLGDENSNRKSQRAIESGSGSRELELKTSGHK